MWASRDLSVQSLFCTFLYSEEFWLIFSKCPKESECISLFPPIFSIFRHIFGVQDTIYASSPYASPFPAWCQLGTQQSARAPAPTSTWARRQNAFGKRQTCLGWSAHAQKAQCALSAPHSLAQTPCMTSEPCQASLGSLGAPTPQLPVCLPAKLGCLPLGGTTKHSPASLETNHPSSQRDPKTGMVWCPPVMYCCCLSSSAGQNTGKLDDPTTTIWFSKHEQ